MPYVLGQALPAGLPPWDGTGVPLPVDANGWPVLPDTTPDITVTPGSTQTVASTDPNVVASPATPWAPEEFATFTDGPFTWDGDSWAAWTEPPPPLGTILAVPNPITVAGPFQFTLTTAADPGEAPRLWLDHNNDGSWSDGGANFVGAHPNWTLDYHTDAFGPNSSNDSRAQLADGTIISDVVTVVLAIPPAADEGFDPSEATVAEVQAYLADHPDQTDYVLDRERAGKARVTLIGD